MSPRRQRPWRLEDDLLDWFYVRYKHVYVVLGLAALGVAVWGSYRLAGRMGGPMAGLVHPGDARFTLVDGIVSVRKAGQGPWVPADRQTGLGRYDLIRTGPQSMAEILFPDSSVVHLRPDSLISLEGSDRDAASGRQVAWHISAGEVFMRADGRRAARPPDDFSEFSTPGASGTLGEAAVAALRVDRVGLSELRQFAGFTRLRTRKGDVVDIASTEAVRVDRRGEASPKVTMPKAPDLLDPPHQAKVVSATPATRVLLSWKPVPGAETYRLVMDRNAYFNGPFVDRRGLTDTSIEVKGLARGQYYWRVAGQGAQAVEGGFSEYARLTIANPEEFQALVPPPLELDRLKLSTDILHVKGITTPGTSVTVNGRRLAVREDGSFSEFVQLDQAGPQTVAIRATGLDGGVVTRRFPVSVVAP